MKQRFIKFLSVVLLLALVNNQANSQEKVYKNTIPNGSLVFSDNCGGSLCPGLTIEDPVYADADLRAQIGTVKKMQNIVRLEINEDATDFIPSDFTASVTVIITKTPLSGGTPETINKTFQLSYKLGMGQKSDAASYFVNDDGGYRLSVQIQNITITGTSWDAKKVLRIVGEIRAAYDAPFNHTEPITGLTNLTPATNPFDELTIEWTYPASASGGGGTFSSFPTHYDIEWAWVEESAEELYKTSGNWDPEKIYFNNATRVTVPASIYAYKIPLFYDGKGRIFYRVRPLQQRTDGQLITGNWTIAPAEGGGYYSMNTGHEEGLNWQVSTTYAEEGKRKTVIQYFDGTLRGRQTVTKDNSQEDPTTVVAETFYDYQGRPTIQVLPAPTLNNVIQFARNFNNNAVDHQGYPKQIYDLLTTGAAVCGNGAPPLEKEPGVNGLNGAGNYYSALNPDAAIGINKFIPEANGYPFAETRYTQDGTGRIMAQSGVGQVHKIGSGHETQYFYAPATQDEIDLLFGTDAGVASHYQRNLVKDANGQFSVSYVDMQGRTIATALAGNKPESLEGLASLNALPVLTPETALRKQLLDPETNVVDGRSIVMVKDIVVTSPGIRYFEYRLDPKQLLLQNCAEQNICYDCLYDLTITITNPCDNTILHTETRSNFTLPHTSTCGTDPDNIDIDFQVYFAQTGSYTITKTLTLSKEAQDQFRENAMQFGNLVCKDFQTIYNEIAEVMLEQNGNCQPTCESCLENLGTRTAFKEAFRVKAGLTLAQMPAYDQALDAAYDQAAANCAAICEEGSDRVNNFREIMLMDMMPDKGQYARILSDATDVNGNTLTQVDLTVRRENIFFNNKYKAPVTENGSADVYKDANNQPDPTGAQANLNVWTPEDFTTHFNESWARQLIYYHPEFKKLQLAESANMKTAYSWQEEWQEKTKWSEVSTVMTGLPGSDPFYNTVLAGSSLQSQMSSRIYNYIPFGTPTPTYFAGMWQFAIAAVKCKDIAAPVDQMTCLQNCPTAIGTFPAEINCDPEKDMVWRIFSSMYFREREVFIYEYLQAAAPVDQSIFSAPSNTLYPRYQPRFVNPSYTAISVNVPANLAGAFNQVISGSTSNSATTAAMQAEYEDNCRSYAVNWLEQVKIFDNCTTPPNNNSITTAEYNALIEQLVAICKAGSDLTHPLGSSSVPPGNTTSPASFEEALEAFMTAQGVTLSESCHPYIITWPKPYNKSPLGSNEEIWEAKPDACICERLQHLKNLHTASGIGGTFSNYLATVHGTTMSATQLALLESLCTATTPPACDYLEEPIILPPVLQCGASDNTCINCDEYSTLRTAFFAKFGTPPSGVNVPVLAPDDETEMAWNKAFADFMNYRTGFAKQWFEYALFEKNCSYGNEPINTPNGVCSRMDTHIANFNTLFPTLQDGETSCEQLFTNYFNQQEGTAFTYRQLKTIYNRCHPEWNTCKELVYCNAPVPEDTVFNEASPCADPLATHLCGLNDPITPTLEIDEDDPCDDVNDLIWNAAIEAYQLYLVKIKNEFDKKYQDKCLAVQSIESFTVRSPDEKEYHYTLYFYDQSGQLVQTIPPAGVDDFNNSISAKTTFLQQVKDARTAGTIKRPQHTLFTKYRYNTLGQVVQQYSPDGGLSKFWYDELGRLVVSQNAKQATTNDYSYTMYDELGRISQVGQKHTTAAIDQSVTRNQASLNNWLHNTGTAKTQITRTVYDVFYGSATTPALDSRLLVQRNLRNRVSYTQVVEEEPANPLDPASWIAAHQYATFYTYDIHGNVDELVQDYNKGVMKDVDGGSNRFKKMAYTYDLISGKVNTVTYQPDYYDVSNVLHHHDDRFYHRYDYDAENKLVLAETSHDGIIWEMDARYFYYKHGPLARTELGQQQVQGIDYAYTLQGWLKGVNSTAISAAPTEDCAPGTGRDILDVFSRQQYGQPNNYVARQEINFLPEFIDNTPDDYTAEPNPSLSPCIPVIAPTPYITGDMGEDGKAASGNNNRWVARDAYSFSLNYYTTTIGGATVNDYQGINTTVQPFATTGMHNLQNTDAPTPRQVARPLFNGNIASMFVNIPKLGEAHLYGYQYDQLNRIVSMDAFRGFDAGSNGWTGGLPTATENYKERVSYDPNGNILSYLRQGSTTSTPWGAPGGPQQMDQLTYGYNTDGSGKLMNNRLRHVKDAIGDGNYQTDVDNQPDDNYTYDEIGNLVKDVKEDIDKIEWTVYGKISRIYKGIGLSVGLQQIIEYEYDAGGNRISKTVLPPDRGLARTTIYVRDASGNVMAVYEKKPVTGPGETADLLQTEAHLYGSRRLGIYTLKRNVENRVVVTDGIYTFIRGYKFFELSNHLGNVLVSVSDRKLQVQNTASPELIAYYAADVVTAVDYYPFGLDMPGRKFGGEGRYGFNGKERDKDMNSLTAYDYGFRIYNPAIGKFLSVDPLTKSFPELTPYQFASNTPIEALDMDGLEAVSCKTMTNVSFSYDSELKIINSVHVFLTTDNPNIPNWLSDHIINYCKGYKPTSPTGFTVKATNSMSIADIKPAVENPEASLEGQFQALNEKSKSVSGDIEGGVKPETEPFKNSLKEKKKWIETVRTTQPLGGVNSGRLTKASAAISGITWGLQKLASIREKEQVKQIQRDVSNLPLLVSTLNKALGGQYAGIQFTQAQLANADFVKGVAEYMYSGKITNKTITVIGIEMETEDMEITNMAKKILFQYQLEIIAQESEKIQRNSSQPVDQLQKKNF